MLEYTNAFTLMRIPFSIFLMPIFWFALLPLENIHKHWPELLLVFVILHVLVYPASNGYNSYFDKDEGSIGGLEKPPKATEELFKMVLIFDFIALILSMLISLPFAIGIAIYLLVSKAYSWDKIRLKKYPFTSTIVVTVFQGGFIFCLINIGIDPSTQFTTQFLWLAVVATLFLMGSYPITQIYQHYEDTKRGDKTLSLMLGIKGTFLFSSVVFIVAVGIMSLSFYLAKDFNRTLIFSVSSLPILVFFSYWFWLSIKDPKQVNFKNTMLMNKISSICLSTAFIAMKFFC